MRKQREALNPAYVARNWFLGLSTTFALGMVGLVYWGSLAGPREASFIGRPLSELEAELGAPLPWERDGWDRIYLLSADGSDTEILFVTVDEHGIVRSAKTESSHD